MFVDRSAKVTENTLVEGWSITKSEVEYVISRTKERDATGIVQYHIKQRSVTEMCPLCYPIFNYYSDVTLKKPKHRVRGHRKINQQHAIR